MSVPADSGQIAIAVAERAAPASSHKSGPSAAEYYQMHDVKWNNFDLPDSSCQISPYQYQD
jgi:hypothetical protein